MVKLLVFFIEIPEKHYIHLLLVNDAEAKELKRCHNHFVNNVNCPPDISDIIMKYFYDKDGKRVIEDYSSEPITNLVVDLFVVTGFML